MPSPSPLQRICQNYLPKNKYKHDIPLHKIISRTLAVYRVKCKLFSRARKSLHIWPHAPDQLRLPLLPPGTAPSPSHAELPPFTSAALKTARLCTRCFLCLECSLGFKPLTTTFQLERFLFSPLCVGHVKLPLQSCFWLPACWVSWPLLSEPPAPAWLLPLILMDFFSFFSPWNLSPSNISDLLIY